MKIFESVWNYLKTTNLTPVFSADCLRKKGIIKFLPSAMTLMSCSQITKHWGTARLLDIWQKQRLPRWNLGTKKAPLKLKVIFTSSLFSCTKQGFLVPSLAEHFCTFLRKPINIVWYVIDMCMLIIFNIFIHIFSEMS